MRSQNLSVCSTQSTSREIMVSDNSSPQEPTATKRQRPEMKIGTHSGTFHADEALAVYMLKLLPKYKNSTVVRSRTPDILEACDIIVDVQGKYDGLKHFDHHQRDFSETFSTDFKTKLSSAGLIFKHFGKEIISDELNTSVDSADVSLLYTKLYSAFVEAIDGNDNGESAYPDNIKPAYNASGITLPSIVAGYNPSWNEPRDDVYMDTQFEKASKLMGEVFSSKLKFYAKSWLPARELVRTALVESTKYDDEGRIMVFDTTVTWKGHLFDLEEEMKIEGRTLYVLYSDGASWRVQAVPVSNESFTSRKPLPEPWRGVRDQALSDLTGIDGGIFVHASGFIGGNKTREGALEMAKKALEM
ncbi:metal-dependent protein hydrolase [Limtongia smithiae]|uniref:metal-dependent protein hydrolase n=1 Tax=Limtongia smithiae TaxID=1125753 RepID=UPI0034CD53DA